MEQDDTKLQFDENGDLRHLLSLNGSDATLLTELLEMLRLVLLLFLQKCVSMLLEVQLILKW